MAEPGRSVGDYVLGRQIGSGSFAVVWKGESKATGEEVAIKEINTDKLNKKLKQSLELEVSILKRIDHQNIVKLYAAIEETNRMYLVMEYCAGGDLAGYIRRCKRLPEDTARELMQQLAAGLKELWSHHLVHRDLKPQNLLLSNSGPQATLKIADFGFARNLQPQGLAETLCGSPLYMAPEILQFHKYDSKADLWSVGTILYELLIGRPPFNGANHVQLLRNIERNEVKIPDAVATQLSEPCKQMILQLLKRNPVERISFEEFFAHPFLCPGAEDQQQPQEVATATTSSKVNLESEQIVASTKPWSAPQHPNMERAFPFIVDTSLPQNPLVAFDTRPKPLEGRQCSYAEMPLKPELKCEAVVQPPNRPSFEGSPMAKGILESQDDSIEDDYVLIDSLPSTSNSAKNSQNQASEHIGSQSSSLSHQLRQQQPSIQAALPHLLDDLTAPEEDTPDTCVFPLQLTEEEFMWEVARILDYLTFCKQETGLLPDALSLHLLSLDVLYCLLTSVQHSSSSSVPQDHLAAQLRQAAQKVALTAEQTANQLQQSGYCYPLPDIVDTVYQNALTLGRGGAVEELLGNYSTAMQAYEKAGSLLHFLCTRMPSLEQTFKVAVNKEHRQLLTKYTLHVSARYCACKNLEAQDPCAALGEGS